MRHLRARAITRVFPRSSRTADARVVKLSRLITLGRSGIKIMRLVIRCVREAVHDCQSSPPRTPGRRTSTTAVANVRAKPPNA